MANQHTKAKEEAEKVASEKKAAEMLEQLGNAVEGTSETSQEPSAPIPEPPVSAEPSPISSPSITLTDNQFKELIRSVVDSRPPGPGSAQNVPEGENFFARTRQQRYARYPHMGDKQAREGRDPAFYYMTCEKLPEQWEHELGSRADALEDVGWEIYAQSNMWIYCRMPMEKYMAEHYNPAIGRAKNQAGAKPADAPENFVVDEPQYEEVSLKEFFDSLSDQEKAKLLAAKSRAE